MQYVDLFHANYLRVFYTIYSHKKVMIDLASWCSSLDGRINQFHWIYHQVLGRKINFYLHTGL